MTTFEQLKKRTLELFQERPDPTDWADNLLEGSKGLQECDYDQYVQFLADPHTSYEPAQTRVTNPSPRKTKLLWTPKNPI